ncbi:hypothetical protein LXA43DRAFT_1064037 [Ganoderma leucocontextum]|nr:hypothetical protein LXA43DRAFT_1064037 [Ganoderma leucocontextum]
MEESPLVSLPQPLLCAEIGSSGDHDWQAYLAFKDVNILNATNRTRMHHYPETDAASQLYWCFDTTRAKPLGGVPHNLYGTAVQPVRLYVLAIDKHLGLREKDMMKVQIGGPELFINFAKPRQLVAVPWASARMATPSSFKVEEQGVMLYYVKPRTSIVDEQSKELNEVQEARRHDRVSPIIRFEALVDVQCATTDNFHPSSSFSPCDVLVAERDRRQYRLEYIVWEESSNFTLAISRDYHYYLYDNYFHCLPLLARSS